MLVLGMTRLVRPGLLVSVTSMDQALIGLAGIVAGVLLGGTGKYFTQRRDAWTQARASGLLLLGDVRALSAAAPDDPVVARTELGVKSWWSYREVLAGFRVGAYPSGFTSPEWIELADHFAQLEGHYAKRPPANDDQWWGDALAELSAAQAILERVGFSNEPPVLLSVIRTALTEGFWRRRGASLAR
jgi:hypothetical protein